MNLIEIFEGFSADVRVAKGVTRKPVRRPDKDHKGVYFQTKGFCSRICPWRLSGGAYNRSKTLGREV